MELHVKDGNGATNVLVSQQLFSTDERKCCSIKYEVNCAFFSLKMEDTVSYKPKIKTEHEVLDRSHLSQWPS